MEFTWKFKAQLSSSSFTWLYLSVRYIGIIYETYLNNNQNLPKSFINAWSQKGDVLICSFISAFVIYSCITRGYPGQWLQTLELFPRVRGPGTYLEYGITHWVHNCGCLCPTRWRTMRGVYICCQLTGHTEHRGRDHYRLCCAPTTLTCISGSCLPRPVYIINEASHFTMHISVHTKPAWGVCIFKQTKL